jgi:molybdate transport system permease protein
VSSVPQRFGERFRQRPPLPVLLMGAAAAIFFALPLMGLILRAPWSELHDRLGSPEIQSALGLSLIASVSATALSVLLGLPLAWLLARADFPGRSLLRALITLPLVLPPVVGGVALILALGRLGLVGRPLETVFGITLFGTRGAVVIAETFVAMPFLVITVEAALRTMDRRYEDAAATLGARRWHTFRRVTLPLIAPALGSGALLAWARALGEFGATITFAGNLPGATQTMPIAVYTELQKDLDGAIVLSLLLVVVSLAVLVLLRDRWLNVS